MDESFTVRALAPETWDAFAALVEQGGADRLPDYRLTCIFIDRDYRRRGSPRSPSRVHST